MFFFVDISATRFTLMWWLFRICHSDCCPASSLPFFHCVSFIIFFIRGTFSIGLDFSILSLWASFWWDPQDVIWKWNNKSWNKIFLSLFEKCFISEEYMHCSLKGNTKHQEGVSLCWRKKYQDSHPGQQLSQSLNCISWQWGFSDNTTLWLMPVGYWSCDV